MNKFILFSLIFALSLHTDIKNINVYKNIMETLKKYLPDLLVVVVFAVISSAYFFPADTEGRIVYRHDASAGRGASEEQSEYHDRTGKITRWSNATFSGMPTYQTAPTYKSTSFLQQVIRAYHLWLPENVWYVFAYLLGFYILLRAFNFKETLAALGSVVWAFSSYFFIIIAAGHIWKVMALAYLPPMIAGVVLSYRGKYLWGFIVTAIFSAFEVAANHVQMTYYFLFVIFFMIIAYLIEAIKQKNLKHFGKATLACAAGAIIGIMLNVSNLYHTWQYSQESMRGKSELVKKNTANQTNSGLDRDYITQWSYGIDETWTLLIPNTKGGASVPLSQNQTAMDKADPQIQSMLPGIYDGFPQYWGTQPGTSGPVYVGAFVLMLFVLGLFIVKGPMKWALLAATILSILLSWGRNFMGFTNFFLDYIPMYAKFRTVASILVIAEFTIPLLAMMALKRIVDEPEILTKKIKFVYISVGLTGGFCLIFALAPNLFFDFITNDETKMLGGRQGITPDLITQISNNICDMRRAMFTSDCWRSLGIIVVGTLFLLLFKAKKLRAEYMIVAVSVLCLGDMWMVNKRYLNDAMFVEKSVRDQAQPMTQTDKQILRDKSLDYRVLNFASNTFNENETSYYHESIGGYHAAKLRRYQELIDAYISPEMQNTMPALAKARGDMTKVTGDSIFPVMNMLNAKYFILPLQGGQTVTVQNPYVYGNAWLVDKVVYVDNANQEIAQLGKINLRHEAVADKKFETKLGNSKVQSQTSLVKITSYKPNNIAYTVQTNTGGVVVFSEIYYPGWTATVDGKSVELGRVNYVLRALNVGPGKHKVVLDFHPVTVHETESIAHAAYVVLLLAILADLYIVWRRKKREEKDAVKKDRK